MFIVWIITLSVLESVIIILCQSFEPKIVEILTQQLGTSWHEVQCVLKNGQETGQK